MASAKVSKKWVVFYQVLRAFNIVSGIALIILGLFFVISPGGVFYLLLLGSFGINLIAPIRKVESVGKLYILLLIQFINAGLIYLFVFPYLFFLPVIFSMFLYTGAVISAREAMGDKKKAKRVLRKLLYILLIATALAILMYFSSLYLLGVR